MIQAIVFADRLGEELSPLCDNICTAMLPVMNRPLLQYTIEDLAGAGVKDIVIVIADHANQVESYFASGDLWGVSIRYLLSRGEESVNQVLSRSSSILNTPFIAIRGDVLRTPCCQSFLASAEHYDGPSVIARMGGNTIGLSLVRTWPIPIPEIDWHRENFASKQSINTEIYTGIYVPLDSLENYHQAILRLMETVLPANGLEVSAGLFADRLSRVGSESHQSGHVVVGANTSIHKSARLQGPCIIGDNCYVDQGANVNNSIVLPGTYIGENLQIENSIVAGNTLFRIDRGVQIQVPDPMLISDIQEEISATVTQWPDRITAVALLILSVPLWVLALFLSLSSHVWPLTKHSIVSNRFDLNIGSKDRRIVNEWRFSTNVPILRFLPKLFLVATGDLRMLGSAPLSPMAFATPKTKWDTRNDQPNSGLLGPAQLQLPKGAPEEEIRLNELTFIARKNWLTTLICLFNALPLMLSKRAWFNTSKELQELA